jgi:hypothetical protein
MRHYDFVAKFRALYDHAVAQYDQGKRSADALFNAEQLAYLAANGITAQYLFDYAEDHAGFGEPGFGNALGIELIRRDYFLNVQNGQPSSLVLDEKTLPGKSDAARGIEWLPRIMGKARAKLHGELPVSLMFCCGGDRSFFKQHDIQPAEFLSLVWRAGDNDNVIIDWVVRRSAAASR